MLVFYAVCIGNEINPINLEQSDNFDTVSGRKPKCTILVAPNGSSVGDH